MRYLSILCLLGFFVTSNNGMEKSFICCGGGIEELDFIDCWFILNTNEKLYTTSHKPDKLQLKISLIANQVDTKTDVKSPTTNKKSQKKTKKRK